MLILQQYGMGLHSMSTFWFLIMFSSANSNNKNSNNGFNSNKIKNI